MLNATIKEFVSNIIKNTFLSFSKLHTYVKFSTIFENSNVLSFLPSHSSHSVAKLMIDSSVLRTWHICTFHNNEVPCVFLLNTHNSPLSRNRPFPSRAVPFSLCAPAVLLETQTRWRFTLQLDANAFLTNFLSLIFFCRFKWFYKARLWYLFVQNKIIYTHILYCFGIWKLI